MDNTSNQLAVIQKYGKSQEVVARFAEAVGKNAAGSYIQSALLAVSQNPQLMSCTPQSIMSSALRAATIQLFCEPSLGHAYLVPFRSKNGTTATLIIGYKGLYQLALRTRQYRFIDVCPIFKGENVEAERLTGKVNITGSKESMEVIGWLGGFRMINGFEKFLYMTVEEIHTHGKRYSRGYDRPDGAWKTNPQEMEKKTVLRLLLSRYGYLDPKAMAVISTDDDSDGGAVDDPGVDFPEISEVTLAEEPKAHLPEPGQQDWMFQE